MNEMSTNQFDDIANIFSNTDKSSVGSFRVHTREKFVQCGVRRRLQELVQRQARVWRHTEFDQRISVSQFRVIAFNEFYKNSRVDLQSN